MAIPSSMGANKLDVRYGDRNTLPYYNGILAPSVLAALSADLSNVATVGAVAGAVYSITTGGYLVPGLLATASTTGGVAPYFGVSGLDINNYPDVLRTRGMPGFSTNPSPAAGGVAAQLPTGTLTVTATGSAGVTAPTATIAVTYGGQNLGAAPVATIGTMSAGNAGTSPSFVYTVVSGVLTAITVTFANTTAMTLGATAPVTFAYGSGQIANTPFPFHGIPSTTSLAGAFATIAFNMAGELSSTRFDTSLPYAPGAALTCIAAGSSNAGRIRTVAQASDTIVGYVAPAGAYMSVTGYPVLAFSPSYKLGTTVPTT